MQHEVLQLSRIAGQFGLPPSEPGPLEVPLDPAGVAWAREWLDGRGGALIGIHGAAKWLSGGWTVNDFLELVRTAANLRPDARVVLTFGPGDTALQAAVEDAPGISAPVAGLLLPGQLPVSPLGRSVVALPRRHQSRHRLPAPRRGVGTAGRGPV